MESVVNVNVCNVIVAHTHTHHRTNGLMTKTDLSPGNLLLQKKTAAATTTSRKKNTEWISHYRISILFIVHIVVHR